MNDITEFKKKFDRLSKVGKLNAPVSKNKTKEFVILSKKRHDVSKESYDKNQVK